MNFENKDCQIQWNENRLKDEVERAAEINSRINFISIIYTVFAVFSVSLFKFLIENKYDSNYIYSMLFLVFVILFGLSIANTIRLQIPKEVAFVEEPRIFYNDLKLDYISRGIPVNDINRYLEETYLLQLEHSLNKTIAKINKKSRFNFSATRFALLAIIPYSICVGLMLVNEKEQIQKIKIINIKDMIKNSTFPKTIIDPAKVIIREPIMIKENADRPAKKNAASSKAHK